MNVKLIINYQEAELSKEEVIALSYGVNRLTDIKSRQGYYSNTFKLPKTATNLEIFGHPDQLNIVDSKRWERLAAWIESDGVQVVYGFAQLQSVGESLEVVVKGGNSDWVDLIKDLKLEDLNLRDLDHKHEQSVIQTNRFNDYTDGFVYPDCDYGYLKQEEQNPHGHYLYPSVFVYRILKQVFEDQGYTLTNDLDSDTTYQSLLLPFSNQEIEHSDEWATDKGFKVNLELTSTTISGWRPVDFTTEDYDNGSNIDLTNNKYDPDDNIESQTFSYSITYSIGSYTGTDTLKIAAHNDGTPFIGTPLVEFENLTVPSAGTHTISGTFEYHAHDNPMHIMCERNNNTITIDSGYIESTSVDKKWIRGSEWNVAKNLPDMLQTDFVKSIVNKFCCIIIPDNINQTVTISKFNDLSSNTIEDWSEKVDISEDDMISFEYGDFKNENTLEYTIDEDDKYLAETPELGKHTITVENIDAGRKELYKSPFSLVGSTLTLNETLTKAAVDLNEAQSHYTSIKYVGALTITAITTSGVVTVASGASGLIPGEGVLMYNIVGALSDDNGLIHDRVIIVRSINSDTEFQLEGSFSGSPVTSGNCRSGVMVDTNNHTYVNVNELNEVQELDEVYFYDLDGAPTYTSTTFGVVALNGHIRFLVAEVISSRCFKLGHLISYTGETAPFGYADVDVTNDSAVSEGTVRFIRKTENNQLVPRIAVHSVSTDASNAITLYGETTETQVSELSYTDITWEQLVSTYWGTLQNIIESPQMVKTLIRLSALDINQIDFSKPKFLSSYGCSFYLSYVDQFKTNQVDSTEVELVKLP